MYQQQRRRRGAPGGGANQRRSAKSPTKSSTTDVAGTHRRAVVTPADRHHVAGRVSEIVDHRVLQMMVRIVTAAQ